jgi:hypothetical protein
MIEQLYNSYQKDLLFVVPKPLDNSSSVLTHVHTNTC